MAEKLIKQFTIGSDTGKIDYEAGVGGNKPDVASITPKKVRVSWTDANILKVKRYRYYASAASYDADAAFISSGQSLFARDGDFGFLTIDEPGLVTDKGKAVYTGQVNLGITLVPNTILINTETETEAYKNFKTPYITCVDELYRFTKIAKSFDTVFSTISESTLSTHNITYNLTIQQPAEGDPITATVTTYRSEEASLAKFKGTDILTAAGTATDFTYSKETGYKTDVTADAQVNFRIHTSTLPEGYAIQVKASDSSKYNKLTKNTTDTEVWKANDVNGDFTINITIKPLAVYNVTYIAGSYAFGDETETPATVTEGTDLIFKFKHQTDGKQPATEPTKAETLAKFSVTVGGNALTLEESFVTTEAGKKKATITIPANKINGAVVVTTATV